MNIDRQAVARDLFDTLLFHGMVPAFNDPGTRENAVRKLAERLAPFFDELEAGRSYDHDLGERHRRARTATDAHLAAIKGEAMSNDPPTTQAASPKKYHSPDYGRGHIAGWDAGFVRALEMAEYIACSYSHDSNVGDAITDAIRALRERKEGEGEISD